MKKKVDRWPVVATLVGVSSLSVLAGTVVTPALPLLEAHFSSHPSAGHLVRMVLTIPSLVIALVSPFAGMLTDRVDRRLPLAVGLVLFGLAGGSGYLLSSLTGILVSRGLVGVGIALIATSVTALIADFYQGDSRSRFMGLQAALMGIGGVFFLAGGGLLAELGWRPPFLLHLIALVFVVPVLFVLWRSERVSEPGAADDARMPWGDVAFLTMAVFAGMGGFYILLVQVPFKLDLLSISPTLSGVAIALSTLVGVFTSLAYAPLKRRFHYSTILSVTFLCIGIGMAVTGYSSSFAGVQGGLLIVGLGIGLIMANCTVWLTSKVPAPLRGRAVGIFMTGLFLGQFLMPLASQLLVADFGLTRVLTSFGGALALLGLAVLKRR